MEKAEIDALLTAHGGRAQIVASLHLLRAPAISAPAQAFLAEHERALATIDLQRWLARASAEQKPAAVAAMARLAERDPARYEYEIARAPSNQPPAPLTAPATPDEGFFDPGELLGDLGFETEAPSAAPAGGDGMPSVDTGLGDLLGDVDLFGGDDAGLPGGSSHPVLDALLADLRADGGRARPAWKARALAAAADTAESWAPAVTGLPPELRDAVLIRAGVSPRSEERAAMLEWLFQNGARRPKLVELTLSLSDMGPEADRVESWLAEAWIPRLLPDKAAWARHGTTVLRSLIGRRAFTELDDLFTAALTGAGALGPGQLSLAGSAASGALRGPLLTAFARALIDAAESAITGKHREGALAAAAALASLRPPARDRAKVRALGRKRHARGEIATLLSLADRRARGPKDAPELEDFIAAVHVLSDAST